MNISEKDNNTTFVTTAIDYPNALPHIGTAFEKIGADVYARFRRFQGRDVYFTMGNDENTVKVLKAAKAVDKHPQRYVDEMAQEFKAVWAELNISYDDFIQTSLFRHLVGVQRFLRTVNAAGYIEKRPYKALYCEGCEEFKSPNSLDHSKRCPNHTGTPLVEREEENYFFLLSAFKERVADLISPTLSDDKVCVEPGSRFNEVSNFINTELTDISISRSNEGWGIPIPWDNTQATYVWFDALLNYLTVIGFGGDWDKFQKYWPAEVHFIGKDITRFHCALFPAMCLAYNEGCDKLGEPQYKLKALPKRIFAHGFVNHKKGNQVVKVSKSGDSIQPQELIEQFGADAYRYYFLSKFNYDTDGDYGLQHFKDVYNSDLANSLGNLVSRTVGMSLQYFDGKIPSMTAEGLKWFDENTALEYEQFIVDCCSYRHAIELIWKIIFNANKFIEDSKPWELVKLPGDTCGQVLGQLVGSLRIISLLIRPFTPTVAEKIYTTFQWAEGWNEVDWEFVKKLSVNNFLGLENGIVINKNVLDNDGKFPVLFPRVK